MLFFKNEMSSRKHVFIRLQSLLAKRGSTPVEYLPKHVHALERQEKINLNTINWLFYN